MTTQRTLFMGFLVGVGKGAAVLATALVVLFAVGWWLAPEEVRVGGSAASAPAGSRNVVWTCSMHPQIRLDRPGKCPICGMDLVPAAVGDGAPGIEIPPEGRRLARVETSLVERGEALLEVRAIGRFALDERRVARLAAWLAGRVDALPVPFAGGRVEAGDPIADLYVPELPALVVELQASRRIGPEVYDLAASRLRRAGVSMQQIEELERQANPTPRVTLRSPLSGIVLDRAARVGDFLKEGDSIALLGALDPLYLDVEVFERDLPFVVPGMGAEVTVDALGPRVFEGTVDVLRPSIDPSTRTVGVRVALRNPEGLARPGMYGRAVFRVALGADGLPLAGRSPEFGAGGSMPTIDSEGRTAPLGESRPADGTGSRPASAPAARFGCPMHCIAPRAEPGRCPKCGMALRELSAEEARREALPVLVAASAILDLGARRLAYVETAEGRYEPRNVALGPRVGERFVVIDGLREGERVVSRGAFLVDSQTQITGKPSLLFPAGAGRAAAEPGHAGHGGHK